ncbi:MAG: hypothetical protein MR450_08265 [Prevotella sp.]|nr:hypothetical protein [Prevotella sp.]MDY4039278.1 hypothetical protein [Prevotella sp.]
MTQKVGPQAIQTRFGNKVQGSTIHAAADGKGEQKGVCRIAGRRAEDSSMTRGG